MTQRSDSDRNPLAEWVEWLVDQYELWDRIPSCWSRHPAIVAELQVMHELHEAVMVAPDAASAMAGWHDQFGRVLDRISQSPAARCARHGEHRPLRMWNRKGVGRGLTQLDEDRTRQRPDCSPSTRPTDNVL